MLTTMNDHFNHKFAEYVSLLAAKALSYEVAVSPKPGLVDRFHNGAHDDMDYFAFLDSIAALTPFFYRTTLRAARFSGSLEELLNRSRFLGKEAESAMLAATGGVNTHKGIIFSLGLICTCAGYLFQKDKQPARDSILALSAEMGRLISKYDFPAQPGEKRPDPRGKTVSDLWYGRGQGRSCLRLQFHSPIRPSFPGESPGHELFPSTTPVCTRC